MIFVKTVWKCFNFVKTRFGRISINHNFCWVKIFWTVWLWDWGTMHLDQFKASHKLYSSRAKHNIQTRMALEKSLITILHSDKTPQLLLKYQQQKTQLPKSKSGEWHVAWIWTFGKILVLTLSCWCCKCGFYFFVWNLVKFSWNWWILEKRHPPGVKISEETPQLLLKYQQQKTQLPKSQSKVRSYDCTHVDRLCKGFIRRVQARCQRWVGVNGMRLELQRLEKFLSWLSLAVL